MGECRDFQSGGLVDQLNPSYTDDKQSLISQYSIDINWGIWTAMTMPWRYQHIDNIISSDMLPVVSTFDCSPPNLAFNCWICAASIFLNNGSGWNTTEHIDQLTDNCRHLSLQAVSVVSVSITTWRLISQAPASSPIYHTLLVLFECILLQCFPSVLFLQCFDAVGWASGRASGL